MSTFSYNGEEKKRVKRSKSYEDIPKTYIVSSNIKAIVKKNIYKKVFTRKYLLEIFIEKSFLHLRFYKR